MTSCDSSVISCKQVIRTDKLIRYRLKTKHSQTHFLVFDLQVKCIAVGRENYYLDPSCKKGHRGTSKVHLLPIANNWNELRLGWMCVF